MTGIPVNMIQVFISTNIGKHYLKKKKRLSEQNYEKGTNLGPEEIYQKPMAGHRKDDQENRHGEAETMNISISKNFKLTQVSGGTHWEYQG